VEGSTNQSLSARPMKIHFECPNGHQISVDPEAAGQPVRCPECGRSVEVPELLPPISSDDRPESDAEQSPWSDSVPVLSPVSGAAETASDQFSERPGADVPVLPAVVSPSQGEPSQSARSEAGRQRAAQTESGSQSDGAGEEKAGDVRPAHPRVPVHPHSGAPPVRKGRAPAEPTPAPWQKSTKATKKPAAAAPAKAASGKPAGAKAPSAKPAVAKPATQQSKLAKASKASGPAKPDPQPTARGSARTASAAVVGEAVPVESSPPGRSRLGLLRRSRRPRREQIAQGNGQQPHGSADRAGEQRVWHARGPRLMPADVYRPDADHVRMVKWLAVFLGLTVLFSLIPVVRFLYFNPETAPGWARFVLLAAAIEGAFILWMLAAPDWASVWVVMLVFAVVAALYGMGTAIATATPPHQPLPLGLAEVRTRAAGWCGAVMLVMALATYVCGRVSAKWRRVYELTRGKRTGAGTR